MFTLIGSGIIVLLAFLANREQNKDSGNTDDYIKYTRQDCQDYDLAACRSGIYARHCCRPQTTMCISQDFRTENMALISKGLRRAKVTCK